jgi:hypothetical protein
MKEKNVLIVRRDATSIAFRGTDFKAICREVKRMKADGFYRIADDNPVFLGEVVNPDFLGSYTVGEMIREISDDSDAAKARGA